MAKFSDFNDYNGYIDSERPSSGLCSGIIATEDKTKAARVVASKDRICHNCKINVTTLWRRNRDGQHVCNTCGLYYKMKGRERPPELWQNDIKRRYRSTKPRLSTSLKERHFTKLECLQQPHSKSPQGAMQQPHSMSPQGAMQQQMSVQEQHTKQNLRQSPSPSSVEQPNVNMDVCLRSLQEFKRHYRQALDHIDTQITEYKQQQQQQQQQQQLQQCGSAEQQMQRYILPGQVTEISMYELMQSSTSGSDVDSASSISLESQGEYELAQMSAMEVDPTAKWLDSNMSDLDISNVKISSVNLSSMLERC